MGDRLRISELLRNGHGDVNEVAAMLGVTVAQVQAVINDPTDSTKLPSSGGGGDRALWKPPYGSLKAATTDPASCQAQGSLLANRVYLSRVYVPDPITLSKVWWVVTTAASGLTSAELSVWDQNMQQIATTGDVHTQFQASGPRSANLTARPGKSLQVGGDGQFVYVGHRQAGTTLAAIAANVLAINSIVTLDGTPYRASSLGGISSIITLDPIDPAGLGLANFIAWYGLS